MLAPAIAAAVGVLGGHVGTVWLNANGWRHDDEPGRTRLPWWLGAVVCGVAAAVAASTVERSHWPVVVAATVWCVVAWVAAVTDAAVMRVPEALVLAGYAVLLAVLGLGAAATGQWRSLGRAVAVAVVLWLVFFVYALVTRMGFADVQLMGLSGLILGWLGWGTAVRAAVFVLLVAGVWAVVLLARGRRGRMAYAPPLLLGVWLAIVSSPW